MKKFLIVLIAFLLILTACAPTAATEKPASDVSTTSATEPKKVAIVASERFGDKGGMDQMAEALDRCAADFGFEIKKLESKPATFEDDIRAMSKEGYDLIFTTYPGMSDPTKVVAQEFPDVKYAAVFQSINVGGTSIPNLWDTEYQSQHAYYLLGTIAANLSTTKKVGLITGAEQETLKSNANAFYRGVKDVCPDCLAYHVFVGSFEDPAKGKEIAMAMINNGVDYIQTDTGNTQLGVLEAAKEAGILFSGDVGDNYDMYPEGFVGMITVDFGGNVYMGCQGLADGTFPGGEHGIMSMFTGAHSVPYDLIERFGNNNPAYTDAVKAAIETAKDLQAKIQSGELVIDHNIDMPVFD